MLILVGVTVTGAINGGLIGTSQEAKYKTQISQIKEALEEEIINRKALKEPTDNITIADLEISDKLKEKYKDKLIILNEEIYYDASFITNENEIKIIEEMNIASLNSWFTYNGSKLTGLSDNGKEKISSGAKKIIIPSKSSEGIETTIIGGSAFKNYSTIEEVVLPETIVSLQMFCFYGCTKLATINLPESITSMESSIFQRCESLEEINLPSKITAISNALFADCTSLKKIKIPYGVIGIGPYSFTRCPKLEYVEIPDSVTTIGYEAFMWDSALIEIWIPASVTTVSQNAFSQAFIKSGGKLHVPFTEEEGKPSGWNDAWNKSRAEIIYAESATE